MKEDIKFAEENYLNAKMRYEVLGMLNTFGVSPHDGMKANAEYVKAGTQYQVAKATYEKLLASHNESACNH